MSDPPTTPTTTPLHALSPQTPLPPTSSSQIQAQVTLLWPYSSQSQTLALQLSDPDFRLRSQRGGRLRVVFAGSAARAVARARVGVWESVRLGLGGGEWAEEREVVFKGPVELGVWRDGAWVRVEGQEEEGSEKQETGGKEAIVEEVVGSRVEGRGIGVREEVERRRHASPAFFGSSRFTQKEKGTSLRESIGFDPFRDADLEEGSPRKRLKLSFGRSSFGASGRKWRFVDDEARSPDMEFAEDPVVGLGTAATDQNRLAQVGTMKGDTAMADVGEDTREDVQTVPQSFAEPLQSESRTADTSAQTERVSSPLAPSPSKAPMAPPPLPSVGVRSSTPPALAPLTIETQNKPLTPKLQPVSAANLPLPSPFPASETAMQYPTLVDRDSSPMATREPEVVGNIEESGDPQSALEIPDTYPDEELAISSPLRAETAGEEQAKMLESEERAKISVGHLQEDGSEEAVADSPSVTQQPEVVELDLELNGATTLPQSPRSMPMTAATPEIAQTTDENAQQGEDHSLRDTQELGLHAYATEVKGSYDPVDRKQQPQPPQPKPQLVESTTPKATPPRAAVYSPPKDYEADELYDVTPPRKSGQWREGSGNDLDRRGALAQTEQLSEVDHPDEFDPGDHPEEDFAGFQRSYLQSTPAPKHQSTKTNALDAPSMLSLDGASNQRSPQSPSKTSPWARPGASFKTPAAQRVLSKGERPTPLSAPRSEKEKDMNRTFRNLFGFRSPSPTKSMVEVLGGEKEGAGVETSPWGFRSVQVQEEGGKGMEVEAERVVCDEPKTTEVLQGAFEANEREVPGVEEAEQTPNSKRLLGTVKADTKHETMIGLWQTGENDAAIETGDEPSDQVQESEGRQPPSITMHDEDVIMIDDGDQTPRQSPVIASDHEEGLESEVMPDAGTDTTPKEGSDHSTVPSPSLRPSAAEPWNETSFVKLSSSPSAASPPYNQPPDIEHLDLSQEENTHWSGPSQIPIPSQQLAPHLRAETVADSFDPPDSIAVDENSRPSTREGTAFDRSEVIEEETLKAPLRIIGETSVPTVAPTQQDQNFPVPTPTTSFEPTADVMPSQELGSLSQVPSREMFRVDNPDELPHIPKASSVSQQPSEFFQESQQSQTQPTAVIEISSSPPPQEEIQSRQEADPDDILLDDFVEQEYIHSPQRRQNYQDSETFDSQGENTVEASALTRDHQLYPELPPTPLDSQDQQPQQGSRVPTNDAPKAAETRQGMLPPTPQLTERASTNAGGQLKQMVDEPSQESSMTPKGTPWLRKSFSGRFSNVPDVISAWFSPKRSSGAAAPEPAQSTFTEKEAGDEEVEDIVAAEDIAVRQTNGASLPSSTAPPRLEQQPNPALGLSTPYSYYTPLTNLDRYLNTQSQTSTNSTHPLDILAIVTTNSKPAERAKSGPRDYYTLLTITDPSLTTTKISTNEHQERRVEIFRPWKATLPFAEAGDVVLLRGFQVKSRKRTAYLLSTDASAWCVWRFGEVERVGGEGGVRARRRRSSQGGFGVREEVKGPPVEFGDGERGRVDVLRAWWESGRRSDSK
ncbi:hypothetical protein MBLNU230_g0627t1 [Neophaeotheca triangularis]